MDVPNKAVIGVVRKRIGKKQLLLIGALGLFCIILAVSVFYVVRTIRQSSSKPTTNTPQTSKAYQQQKQKATTIFAQKDAAKKAAAEKVISTTTTAAAKANAYLELARVADISGNANEALSNAQKALQAQADTNTYVAVAFYAKKTKSYDLAREMYGKAADAAKKAGGDNAVIEYENYKAMQTAVPKK